MLRNRKLFKKNYPYKPDLDTEKDFYSSPIKSPMMFAEVSAMAGHMPFLK